MKRLFAIDPEKSAIWSRALLILIALNILIPILFVTSPVGLGPEGDALDYRLPLIQWALAHGSYPDFPWTVVDDYPAFGEVLMAIFRPFAEWGPRIVSVAGYAFFVLGTLRLGKLFLPGVWALTGTLLVSSAHLVLVQDNLVMLDVFASSLTLWSSIYLLEDWKSSSPRTGNYLKAGVFAGLAAATRYTQFPPLAVLGVFCFLAALRDQPGTLVVGKRLLFFGAPIILFVSPWLIRNAVVNGNPFFPLAFSVFGGKDLDLSRSEEFMNYVNSYGFGTAPKELLLLFQRFAFYKDIFDYSVGPLPLAFLPWTIVFFALAWKKSRRDTVLAFLFLAFTAAWFYTAKQGRFLVHALPFGVFSGLLGAWAWSIRFDLPILRTVFCAFFAVMGVLGTVKHAYKHRLEIPPAKIVVYQRDVPEWLNENMSDGKVLLYERTHNLFMVKGDFVFAYPHAYATRRYDYRQYSDSRSYYSDLYAEGIRFVYVTDPSVISKLPVVPEEVLRPVYIGKEGGAVYELRKI